MSGQGRSPDSTECFGSCSFSDFSGKLPDLNVSTILIELKGDLLLVERKVAFSHTLPHTFSLRRSRVSSTRCCRDPTHIKSIVKRPLDGAGGVAAHHSATPSRAGGKSPDRRSAHRSRLNSAGPVRANKRLRERRRRR